MRRCALFLLAALGLITPATAEVHQATIRLDHGRLETAEISAAVLEKLHLPGVGIGSGWIDLSGMRGTLFVDAINAALGDGGRIDLRDDQLVLNVDPEKLPRNYRAIERAIRTFTAAAAPDATANQRREYGLLMPKVVDPRRPMVVLIQGLDCGCGNSMALGQLLEGRGFQPAYFSYPSDGPIEDSAAMLTQNMKAVRETFPQMQVDIVGHSMGGLIARRYVEGDEYAGGVRHLILVATPNGGTRWATFRFALEVVEHYQLWKNDPNWRPSWMITDGLGEAGDDLQPRSDFLTQLNSRPRREGVMYTIIAGDQNVIMPMTAHALDGAANVLPARVAGWWGFRQTEGALHSAAERVSLHTGKSDGPVSLKSTRLEGVDDYVVVRANHNSLYLSEDGQPPAAWGVIRDRFARLRMHIGGFRMRRVFEG